MVRVAGVGAWHYHSKDFTKYIADYPDCEVAAVYAKDEAEAKEWAEVTGCPYVKSYQEILDDPTIDGIMVATEISLRPEIFIAAAKAGKHIFTEKPAFSKLEDAYAVRDAVLENGVKFMISDPLVHVKQQILWAKQKIDEGLIGRVTAVRGRSARGSNHPMLAKGLDGLFEKGVSGGVMGDLGCHALHILADFLGRPLRAKSLLLSIGEEAAAVGCDDNSMALFEYPNSVIAVAETAWVTTGHEDGFIISGSEGVICCMDDELRYRVKGAKEWTYVPKEEWPAKPSHPLKYWTDCIAADVPISHDREDIELAVLLCEMTTAAYAAVDKTVTL